VRRQAGHAWASAPLPHRGTRYFGIADCAMARSPLYSALHFGWNDAPAAGTGRRISRGAGLSIPNLITLARILLVPVIVWAIASNQMQIALGVFLVAGLSDLIDGFLPSASAWQRNSALISIRSPTRR